MADNDASPSRIRWQAEPGLFAGFSGYAGTLAQPLFRVYSPESPDGDHAMVGNLPALPDTPAYGTEAEVKAEAERWLAGLAASLGAVFPDITDWGVRFAGPDGAPCGDVQRYYDEADARGAKREVEALCGPDRIATVMSRQTWAGPWKEAVDGG